MRNRKNLPLIEKVRVTDIGAEGNAVARINNQVVFVPMVIPGDVADIQVTKKRKKYLEGKVIRFHEYSPDRIKPKCIHFGICGGCKWQHLPYNLQLHYKEKQVMDNLSRIGKVDLPDIRPILGSSMEYYYRNKLEYTFSNKRWLTQDEIKSGIEIQSENALGFHIHRLFNKVLDIKECFLQPEPSDSIRNSVREYSLKEGLVFFDLNEQSGFLRNLVIRNSLDGKLMVIVVLCREDKEKRIRLLDFLSEKFPQISSLMYSVNSKRNDSLGSENVILYKGDDHLIETMVGLNFRIGPKSFYQTNTKHASELYRVVKNFAGLSGNELVYDLYTGTGTIACFVGRSARRVVGIEYVDDAVRDAELNSRMNGIQNISFFAGDIRKVFSEEFISNNGRPDVVITDPPRNGMDEEVVKTIMKASPSKIVYVSCNPSTQARDISILSEKFIVTDIQPVDMFPQTHHVENVVLLKQK